MTDAGFFRGTSSEQDNRFSDKEKKLLKQMKFSDNLLKKVEMSRVNLTAIKPWIANRISELLGMEDDVLNEFVYNQLEENNPDGRRIQINLTGFLNGKNARVFTGELWDMLLDAMSNSGIPTSILNAKKEEISQRIKAEQPALVVPEIKDAPRNPRPNDNRSNNDDDRRSNYSSRYHHDNSGDRSSHHQDKYRRRHDEDSSHRGDRQNNADHRDDRQNSRDHRDDRQSNRDDRPSNRDDRYGSRDDRSSRDDRPGSRDDRQSSRSHNNSNRRSRFSDSALDIDQSKPRDADAAPAKDDRITLQEKRLPDRRSGDDSPAVEMKKRKKSKHRHHRKRKSSSSSDRSDADNDEDDDDDRQDRRKKRRSSREKKKKKKSKKSSSRDHSEDKSLEQELRIRALESMKRQKIDDNDN